MHFCRVYLNNLTAFGFESKQATTISVTLHQLYETRYH